MSVKYIDILTGKVEIKSEFQNLTFTSEDFNASVKYPLFYIATVAVDSLYPRDITNASEMVSIMENLKKEMQTEYESLVTQWYAVPENTDETIGAHELDEVDYLRIKADAKSPDKAVLFLDSLATSDLNEKYEVYIKLKCIYKYYDAKPFALCMHPKSFHDTVESSETVDKEVINKIYENKSIKFLVNLTDSGSVSFTKMDAFAKSLNMVYMAVDRDFSDENISAPNTIGQIYAQDEVPQEFYDVEGPLSNFVPTFNLKNSCGVTNTSFDPEASGIFSDTDLVLATKIFNLEEVPETLRVGLTVKEVVLPVVADEMYLKYNGLQANTVFDYIELPFEPTFYMKGQGSYKDDIADDYKCLNMTSLVDKDGYLSHMVCKNEEDYYSKEYNIKIGTEKTLEEMYVILKTLADTGKLKESKIGEISFVVNNYMTKLIKDRTVDNIVIRKLSFEEVLNEDSGMTEKKLVVEVVVYFSVGFTKVEVFNTYVF